MTTRRVRVFGSYRNLSASAVDGLDAIIVDVLRMTTTTVFAVSRGAGVLPLAGEAEALARGRELGDRAILVGERMGARLEGFHSNNSPSELARLELGGKLVVITTTNGTQAVAACRRATRVVAGALTNATAVARLLCAGGALSRDVAIVCAGRSTGALATEDLLGAGAIVDAIATAAPSTWIADGAQLARDLFVRSSATLHDAVRACDAATELLEHGGDGDIAAAARFDSVAIAPVLVDDVFRSA